MDEIGGEEVRQHRKIRGIAWGAGSLIAFLIAGATILFLTAEARRELADQRLAIQQSQEAIGVAQSGYVDRALLMALMAYEESDDPIILGSILNIMKSNLHLEECLHFENHKPTAFLFSKKHNIIFASGCRTDPRNNDSCLLGQILLLDDQFRQHDVIDVETNQDVADRSLVTMRISPDERFLAYNTWGDYLVHVYDLEKKSTTEFRTLWAPLTAIEFHPMHDLLVTGSWGEEAIVVRRRKDGKVLKTIEDPIPRGVNSISLSNNGKWLAAGYRDDGKIEIWRILDRDPYLELLTTIHSHQGTEVRRVVFSPDSQLLATGGKDDLVRLWNMPDGSASGQPLSGHTQWLVDVDFMPDGRSLVSASWDATLLHWDLESRTLLDPPFKEHHTSISDIHVLSEGERIVSTAADGSAILWTTQPRGTITEVDKDAQRHIAWDTVAWPQANGDKGIVSELDFDSTETLLAAGIGNDLKLWDLNDKLKPHVETLGSHDRHIWGLDVHPTMSIAASASVDGVIKIWDIDRREIIACFRHDRRPSVSCDGPLHVEWPFEAWVDRIEFSPTEPILVTSGRSGSLILWDIANKKIVWSIKTLPVNDFTFHPSGSHLVVGGPNGKISIVDLHDGSIVREFSDRTGWIRTIAFDDSGRYLVSVADGEPITVWEFEEGTPIERLRGHSNWVHDIKFIRNETTTLMVSADHDGGLVFWDGRTFNALTPRIPTHTSWIRRLAVAPTKKILASSDGDGNIILHDLSIDALLDQACKIANRSIGVADWEASMGGEATYRIVCNE